LGSNSDLKRLGQNIRNRSTGEKIEGRGSIIAYRALGHGWQLIHAFTLQESRQFLNVSAFLAAGEENDETEQRGSLIYHPEEEFRQLVVLIAELPSEMVHAADVGLRIVHSESRTASEVGDRDVIVGR